MPPKIVVICGPTASGKTALGVALAKELGGEVVSADSMQIYRGMDVGTAKPTMAEREGVAHHMLDVADPGEDFSVARYVDMAAACVDDILSRGKVPLVVGGTGLYIDSLLSGRRFAPFAGQVRRALQRRLEEEGIGPLYERLRQVDPQRADKLPLSDEKRILRALEVWEETGKTITQHDLESRSLPPRYQAATIFLNYAHRAQLWERIDRRVDQMVEQGLAAEVEALLGGGVSPAATAMQAIGYKELTQALQGKESMEEAIGRVKLRSRQYAKRQVTWFRRYQEAFAYEWEKLPDFTSCLQGSTAFVRGNRLG